MPSFIFGNVISNNLYYKDDPYYIPSSSFPSLKSESLNNNIYCIDINIWQQLVEKATSYTKTNYVKNIKAKDYSMENKKDEIPVGSPISISHIIPLFMYCNNDKLQYLYKKYGCRYYHNKQTLKELKEKHKEIYHWYRLLFQLCYFYGNMCQRGDVFYTGLNIRLNFNTFNPTFYAPISTSTSYLIAEKFADAQGLIIQLQPTVSCRDKFFDCELFSDFPDEKEKLFFIAQQLEIIDIDYYNSLNVHTSIKWIPCFKLFNGIFNGNYVFLTSKRKEIGKWQRNLLKLIKTYKIIIILFYTKRKMNGCCYNVPVYINSYFINYYIN